MSFLKEFKEDLSKAVNELVDEKVDEKKEESAVAGSTETVEASEDEMVNTIDGVEPVVDVNTIEAMMSDVVAEKEPEEKYEEEKQQPVEEAPAAEEISEEIISEEPVLKEEKEETIVAKNDKEDDDVVPSDEVAEITKGTSITGNIESDGSVNVYGKIKGDITCKGKLIVTGRITGTSNAREIFANNAKISGDVYSDGTIKIGNGSVIVGNVFATSAVIGGAIKGDIDVKGPVIVDGTAVVQGNIKSRSVQINNGAVIEGFCSQCYADIDYKSLFEDTFAIN